MCCDYAYPAMRVVTTHEYAWGWTDMNSWRKNGMHTCQGYNHSRKLMKTRWGSEFH